MLRIAAMVLIVILHLIQNDERFGGLLAERSFDSGSMVGLKLFANIGVSLFALITGYFGVRFSYRKVFSLMFKTWFYSLLFTVGFFLMGMVSLRDLAATTIPLSSHWYITAYIMLMMVCLFAGEKINAIPQGQFKTWLIVGFPMLYICSWLKFDIGTSVILLTYLYCLARYIARFQPINRGGVKRLLCLSLVLFIGAWAILMQTRSAVLFKLLGANYSPIVLLLSVSILLWTVSGKSVNSAKVNHLAGHSLAVYLISETRPVRDWLLSVQHAFDYKATYIVLFAIAVYLACSIIDRWLSPIETALSGRIFNLLKKIRNKIYECNKDNGLLP